MSYLMYLGVNQLLMGFSSFLFVLSKELPPSPDTVDRFFRVLRDQSNCQCEHLILMQEIT